MAPRGEPLALVMGDVDLVRALGVAGISSAFFGFADDSARFSRHVRVSPPWLDQWERQEELAASHDLPVPRAQRLHPSPDEAPPELDACFPLVVKPITRTPAWTRLAGSGKALHMLAAEDFAAAWPQDPYVPVGLQAEYRRGDLTGQRRAGTARIARSVSWCDPLQDLRAARAASISPLEWLRGLLRCRAISGLAWRDPMPFLRGKLWAAVWRRVAGRTVSVARRAVATRTAQ
jgi:hypothetical protein